MYRNQVGMLEYRCSAIAEHSGTRQIFADEIRGKMEYALPCPSCTVSVHGNIKLVQIRGVSGQLAERFRVVKKTDDLDRSFLAPSGDWGWTIVRGDIESARRAEYERLHAEGFCIDAEDPVRGGGVRLYYSRRP